MVRPPFGSEDADSMSSICGVDGCRQGWVAVFKDLVTRDIRWGVFGNVRSILADQSMPTVVAIDVPIGLPNIGPRKCDLAARSLLGARASSVFPAPIRPLLATDSHPEASALRRSVEGKGLSIQAWAIVPKIREVDELLRASVEARSVVREVHPELCFMELNDGRPMQHPKRKAAGRVERLSMLGERFGEVVEQALTERSGAWKPDDMLDAFVALWTAERIVAGTAYTIPDSPGRDQTGLPMEMWV